MERVVGIDLGTTNSVVAYFEQGQPVVIPNAEGSKTTPSVVFYKSPDEILVGELAKRHFVTHPQQVIRSVKRFMGTRYSEIGQKMQGIGYRVVEGPNDSILIDLGWTLVSPEQVSAEILRKMKRTAEDFFGEEVRRAVVTVPAYFNDNQRQATKYAGELAGLEVLRIINEPTAAALAYGVDRKTEQKIAVFDLGGGTFDVSILELSEDVFEVRSTRGDTFLGGDTIDEILLDHVMARFFDETGFDLATDIQAFQRLREAVEKVKCELSTSSDSLFSLPFIGANPDGPLHMNYELVRPDFEEMIAPVLPRLTDCCRQALEDADIDPKTIGQALLVGGSTRIPAVQNVVREFFNREPNKSLHPDEAVAIGAAIQGAILTGGLREVLLLDVTPLSLGIEVAGGVFSTLIPRNSSIPTAVNKSFTTVRDNQSVVKVHVLQGERKQASENHSLGNFRLTGITAAPMGIPAINVHFQIDANGILHVSATDATSGVTKQVTIEGYGNMSQDQADQIVRTAEEQAESDRVFMRLAFLRSQADLITQQLNFALEEDAEAIEPEFVRSVREAAFKFDLAAAQGDTAAVDTAYARLKELGNELAGRVVLIRATRRE